jgi:ATP-binding cassette, subfamily B, bacterial
MAGLFLFGSGLSWLRSQRLQHLTIRLAFTLRSTLFHRILRLPMADLTEMKTGGILSRLSSDVDATTGLLQQALLSPVLSTVRLVVTLCIIFSLNWRIATAVMVVLPPILLVQRMWARRIRLIWKSMGQDRQEIDARVSEGLSGVRIVRGFGREQREELAYTVGHHTVIRKQMLATRAQRSVALIWDLLMPLAQVTIIGFGGYLVVQGQATLGVLIAFQGYVWRLLEPVMQIASSISETQRGLAAMERVFEVLDKPEEKPDAPDAVAAPEKVESLRFEHVSFAYRPDVPVLHDFDLTVPGGSVIALVGASGAGKTTLTDLVARFYDPTAGRILLNGLDLRKIRLKSFRALLGVVQQEVFLFDGSVRENIAYGRIDASEAEVLDAARRANAEEFIRRLPEGYDTLIGERGVKLSGGQRQRLSIARALLADPQILILDEATSNLDTESDPGLHRRAAARPHDVHHCPPAEHHHTRRPDRGAGRWAHGRARHARRAPTAWWSLRGDGRPASAARRATGIRGRGRSVGPHPAFGVLISRNVGRPCGARPARDRAARRRRTTAAGRHRPRSPRCRE